MGNAYAIVPSYTPSADAIAAAVEPILALFGDPRDRPIGVELAVRADVLFEAARYVVDVEMASGRLVTVAQYQRMQQDYERRIEEGGQQNARQADLITEAGRKLAAAMADLAKGDAAIREMTARNQQLDAEIRTQSRIAENLRKSEEQIQSRLNEVLAESQSRRDGYFRQVEALEAKVQELEAKLDRGNLAEEPPAPNAFSFRLDLADRLEAWALSEQGADARRSAGFTRGIDKAIELLRDRNELPLEEDVESGYVELGDRPTS